MGYRDHQTRQQRRRLPLFAAGFCENEASYSCFQTDDMRVDAKGRSRSGSRGALCDNSSAGARAFSQVVPAPKGRRSVSSANRAARSTNLPNGPPEDCSSQEPAQLLHRTKCFGPFLERRATLIRVAKRREHKADWTKRHLPGKL
jgi:hypothetical protein